MASWIESPGFQMRSISAVNVSFFHLKVGTRPDPSEPTSRPVALPR